MSYVAITKQLTTTIERLIHNMHAAEVGGEKEPEAPILSGAEDWLAEKLWGPLHKTQFERLPELTAKQTSLTFRIVDCMDAAPRSDVDVSLECRGGVPRWYYTDENGDRNYSVKAIEVTRATHPYFEAYSDHRRACAEIGVRWAAVKKQITEFLGACKSANEAVKLWPDISRYLPSETLAKINEKTEKPKRDASQAMAKLAAMDVEQIAASTVLARLVSAGS